MEPRDMPFAAAARGVTKGKKGGIVCCHPCGGGDEPIKCVYDGYKPWVVGYRLSGANCAFADGHVLTVSETVSAKTMGELLTAEDGTTGPVKLP
jgi:prepilin-type processing-associated H-X9-DG protein